MGKEYEPFRDTSSDQQIISASAGSKPSIKDKLLVAAVCCGVSVVAVGLVAFVEIARNEIALEQERQLLVGKCFDNGIGGVGRLMEVWSLDRGLLAFPSGYTTAYPFKAITETACPARQTSTSEVKPDE
ncbi:hypothetical protein G6L37_00240 [Agrobacterium rubi]|nr:hypothetical protein [Agrobacterium rubi]NTF23679.1 hypothetical protein [Agrobacterium rubi]